MDPHTLTKPVDGHVRSGWPFWIAFFAGLLLIPAALYATFYSGVPERDFAGALWNLLSPAKREYTLYTGTPGGTYDRLAKAIVEQIVDDKRVGFKLKLASTNGSLENAMNVNGSSHAFAFVTEPLVSGLYQGQAPPLQRIAPLYMQRTFLAYNKARWEAFASAQCRGTEQESLRLTDDRASCAYRFLAQARWDAGPLGGGGRMILNHLLHAAGMRLESLESSATIKDQAKKLAAGQVHVAFCFAGDLNDVFDAVKASRDRFGMAGVDAQLGIALRSIELRPNSFTDENRQVETLGAYAVLVASPDVTARDAAIVVRKATAFVTHLEGGLGTHLDNVAAALESRSAGRNAHLFGVAGQFLIIMLSAAFLCATAATAFDSRLHRKRIMQEHSRLLQQIRGSRDGGYGSDGDDTHQAPAEPPCDFERLDEEIERTRIRIHELAVAGRLSLPHRDQLVASAAAVERELKRQIRFHVAALGAGQRAWLYRRGYLDTTDGPAAPSNG